MNVIEALQRETRQITGKTNILKQTPTQLPVVVGSPDMEGKVYDIWVEYTIPINMWWWPNVSWKHFARNEKYCRVESGTDTWRYRFEDGDDTISFPGDVAYRPDWDFDEPTLRIEKKSENAINVTVEAYGGMTWAKIGCGDKILWEKVGGGQSAKVGETTEIINPPIVNRVGPVKQPWSLPWWVWPTAIGIGAGTIFLIVWKKVK